MRKIVFLFLLAAISAPLWAQIGTATLSWQHSGLDTLGQPIGIYDFRIYRSTIAPVGPYTQIDSVPGGTQTYIESALYNGTYHWTVTARSNLLAESEFSNFASKTIAEGGGNDSPLPTAPENLTVL